MAQACFLLSTGQKPEKRVTADKVGIRPLPSARNWRRDPKARGMLAISGAGPARFSVY